MPARPARLLGLALRSFRPRIFCLSRPVSSAPKVCWRPDGRLQRAEFSLRNWRRPDRKLRLRWCWRLPGPRPGSGRGVPSDDYWPSGRGSTAWPAVRAGSSRHRRSWKVVPPLRHSNTSTWCCRGCAREKMAIPTCRHWSVAPGPCSVSVEMPRRRTPGSRPRRPLPESLHGSECLLFSHWVGRAIPTGHPWYPLNYPV